MLLIVLLKDIIIQQDHNWEAQKARHVTLDDCIPTAKNYQRHIYFVFKLGELALLGSKRIAYEYAYISRYLWHVKNGIKTFCEKYPGSIIILEMVNVTFACVERK